MSSPSGGSDDGRLFEGVRFVLAGFDPVTESQYRSDMVRRGGVDAERLGNECTHLVVFGLLYDAPECVAARVQEKKVVSELWVDDSLDRGVLADADKALYWPVREHTGIPGAESLIICLTGFQKQYREDIMKMVSLMGAEFSKPLRGNLVTHLICYKFEGEKYGLAKKVHIKLVNHRWLEDCLKAWKILPVDDYSKKSTWELELMEAHVNDFEDEAEDIGQSSVNLRSRVRCTHSLRNGAETSINPDVNAPMQSPIPNVDRGVVLERHLNSPGHIRETEDANSKTHYITAQGSPDASMFVTTTKADVTAPIENPSVLGVKRKSAVARNMNSLNPYQESEEKSVGARTLDNASDATGTPNCPMSKLGSSKVNREKHQDKDAPSGNFVAAVIRSNIDNNLTDEKSNLNSGDEPMSNNINNPSNSEKASQKSLATESSVHHTASHQKTEESKLRVDSNNYSLETGQQQVVEHAEVQCMKSNETNKDVAGLGAAYGQQMNKNSPTSLKLQKEDVVSKTSPLHFSFVSRLSDASETVVVPSVETKPAEDVDVDLEKQQSNLSTSRQSRPRKTSHKNADPVNEGKPTELSSCGKNVRSLSKTRTLQNTMKKNKSVISYATVQEGNTNSGFSFDNMDGENAETSASAVNKDHLHLVCETVNAHAKEQAHGISEHDSRNSQIVSCSGVAGITTTGPDGNDSEVAAAAITVSFDATVKEGKKQFRNASSNVQGETSHSKEVRIPTERMTGAKRPQSAFMEIDGSVLNSGKKLVSETSPAEVIPPKHEAATSENGCTASAAKPKSISPKIPISRVRTRNALTKMDGARVAPNLEEISQKNTELNPTKISDNANADAHKNNQPKKLTKRRGKITVAIKSQKSVTNRSGEALVDKTESVAADSLFNDLFPEDNVEDCPKMLSSSASASNCGTSSPKNVSNPSVRNAVAKRKMNAVEHKIGNKCGKVGSAIASVAKAVSSMRIKEMSCNFKKVTAEHFEKYDMDGPRDVSGLFCQDSTTDDKTEGVHNSKMRNRKCNEGLTSDHEKENRQDHSNLTSKSNAGTGSLCSKSDSKPMTKDTFVLDKLQSLKGKCNEVLTSDHEKENRQDHSNLTSKSNAGTDSLCSNSDSKPMTKDIDVLNKLQSLKGNECRTSFISEPMLFILSGNRQQRAGYRSILRRLKGRVCRDSHHWSYQATHFIAPEPLRRTEKFFAATAAGRWILKSNYLSSCIEAGKFLEEEPFEWFGTGLSDGEKISLEAPRKWRMLRQQTHHGAFYGMQIIVYGQLILPTLDTVKRAVQAGDGTILATSPPYTRFLDSGVDFAVVSASIPSADAWVQEFIRHGIPCVSADYLVEYVCKPGHPLDSHVLFETDDLANKSLEKLMKNHHQVAIDEAEQSEDEDHEDLSCSVCGRKDRGDVMLICGDEDGKAGCGIGMHIDCGDPPLDAVPDEDWLCSKCRVPKTKKKPTRTTGRKLRPSKEM